LSALHQFLDHPSIDQLSQVLGLQSLRCCPALVDKLERDGAVRRASGADGRTAAVRLPGAAAGWPGKVEESRLRVLQEALTPLTPAEREALAALLERVLVGAMGEPGATRWICRLCDLSVCEPALGRCPIDREPRTRYG
jgi:hypothetical protein